MAGDSHPQVGPLFSAAQRQKPAAHEKKRQLGGRRYDRVPRAAGCGHIDVGGHTCGYTKDNTIAELGAFGVVYYLMMWAAEHDPRSTAEERAYALNQAASLRCAVFCQECR